MTIQETLDAMRERTADRFPVSDNEVYEHLESKRCKERLIRALEHALKTISQMQQYSKSEEWIGERDRELAAILNGEEPKP